MISIGETIGAYTVRGVLGAGRAAVVYRAEAPDGSTVAVKMFRPALAGEMSAQDRWTSEMNGWSGLRHPSVVRLLAVGEESQGPFLVMEYVPGVTLQAQVEGGGPLPPYVAATIMQRVAEGLDHAHGKNIVHRDVAPANILLASGGITKLTDFGLARALDGTGNTKTGEMVGTIDYAAPEQIVSSKSVGPSADVYGVGATLFFALTGKTPFEGWRSIMERLEASPPAVTDVNPDVPEFLDRLVRKSMDPDPARRHRRMSEIAMDLRVAALMEEAAS